MNCPVCNVELNLSERQGIEIDYCPRCRGIWLDRGEIDKIIERSSKEAGAGGHTGDRHRHEYYDHKHYEQKKHRRKSFLEELFD